MLTAIEASGSEANPVISVDARKVGNDEMICVQCEPDHLKGRNASSLPICCSRPFSTEPKSKEQSYFYASAHDVFKFFSFLDQDSLQEIFGPKGDPIRKSGFDFTAWWNKVGERKKHSNSELACASVKRRVTAVFVKSDPATKTEVNLLIEKLCKPETTTRPLTRTAN